MKFSVIIPTYNRANFISKTIHSVLEQTYPDFEVIIVDDGSTDNTEEVVMSIKDDRIRYYKKENEERGAARNFGARLAVGDYINFFDSDDLAYSNHLETAYNIVKQNNFPEVFALSYDILDKKTYKKKKILLDKDVRKKLVYGNILSCNGVFIRRDITQKFPFSENRALSASEDYILWLQLASRYVFFTSSKITSTIINHSERSVIKANSDSIIKRKLILIDLFYKDEAINKYYKGKVKIFESYTYLYVSLHLSLIKNYRGSFKYLLLSLKSYPWVIFSRRFLAVIKHLIL